MRNSNRKLYYLAFTERGLRLAERLAAAFGGSACQSRQSGGVQKWTEQYFPEADGLVYVGAAGIAVRAIAPFIKSKTTDPAVIVIDEGGSFVIPVLSGHLGGANNLARELAALTGGIPVITTATDVSGKFAADEWARKQNCQVINPEKIVQVSSKILSGREILVKSDWPVSGAVPELVRQTGLFQKEDKETVAAENLGPDILVSIRCRPGKEGRAGSGPEDGIYGTPLRLVPRIAVLGVGCRRGTPAVYLEECFRDFMEKSGLDEAAVCAAASIDLKKDEAGLLQFCRNRDLPFHVYTAKQLMAVKGNFAASSFVKEITGVDNVCERSAVLASEGGELLVHKTVYEGVTMALAVQPYYPDWEWL